MAPNGANTAKDLDDQNLAQEAGDYGLNVDALEAEVERQNRESYVRETRPSAENALSGRGLTAEEAAEFDQMMDDLESEEVTRQLFRLAVGGEVHFLDYESTEGRAKALETLREMANAHPEAIKEIKQAFKQLHIKIISQRPVNDAEWKASIHLVNELRIIKDPAEVEDDFPIVIEEMEEVDATDVAGTKVYVMLDSPELAWGTIVSVGDALKKNPDKSDETRKFLNALRTRLREKYPQHPMLQDLEGIFRSLGMIPAMPAELRFGESKVKVDMTTEEGAKAALEQVQAHLDAGERLNESSLDLLNLLNAKAVNDWPSNVELHSQFQKIYETATGKGEQPGIARLDTLRPPADLDPEREAKRRKMGESIRESIHPTDGGRPRIDAAWWKARKAAEKDPQNFQYTNGMLAIMSEQYGPGILALKNLRENLEAWGRMEFADAVDRHIKEASEKRKRLQAVKAQVRELEAAKDYEAAMKLVYENIREFPRSLGLKAAELAAKLGKHKAAVRFAVDYQGITANIPPYQGRKKRAGRIMQSSNAEVMKAERQKMIERRQAHAKELADKRQAALGWTEEVLAKSKEKASDELMFELTSARKFLKENHPEEGPLIEEIEKEIRRSTREIIVNDPHYSPIRFLFEALESGDYRRITGAMENTAGDSEVAENIRERDILNLIARVSNRFKARTLDAFVEEIAQEEGAVEMMGVFYVTPLRTGVDFLEEEINKPVEIPFGGKTIVIPRNNEDEADEILKEFRRQLEDQPYITWREELEVLGFSQGVDRQYPDTTRFDEVITDIGKIAREKRTSFTNLRELPENDVRHAIRWLEDLRRRLQEAEEVTEGDKNYLEGLIEKLNEFYPANNDIQVIVREIEDLITGDESTPEETEPETEAEPMKVTEGEDYTAVEPVEDMPPVEHKRAGRVVASAEDESPAEPAEPAAPAEPDESADKADSYEVKFGGQEFDVPDTEGPLTDEAIDGLMDIVIEKSTDIPKEDWDNLRELASKLTNESVKARVEELIGIADSQVEGPAVEPVAASTEPEAETEVEEPAAEPEAPAEAEEETEEKVGTFEIKFGGEEFEVPNSEGMESHAVLEKMLGIVLDKPENLTSEDYTALADLIEKITDPAVKDQLVNLGQLMTQEPETEAEQTVEEPVAAAEEEAEEAAVEPETEAEPEPAPEAPVEPVQAEPVAADDAFPADEQQTVVTGTISEAPAEAEATEEDADKKLNEILEALKENPDFKELLELVYLLRGGRHRHADLDEKREAAFGTKNVSKVHEILKQNHPDIFEQFSVRDLQLFTDGEVDKKLVLERVMQGKELDLEAAKQSIAVSVSTIKSVQVKEEAEEEAPAPAPAEPEAGGEAETEEPAAEESTEATPEVPDLEAPEAPETPDVPNAAPETVEAAAESEPESTEETEETEETVEASETTEKGELFPERSPMSAKFAAAIEEVAAGDEAKLKKLKDLWEVANKKGELADVDLNDDIRDLMQQASELIEQDDVSVEVAKNMLADALKQTESENVMSISAEAKALDEFKKRMDQLVDTAKFPELKKRLDQFFEILEEDPRRYGENAKYIADIQTALQAIIASELAEKLDLEKSDSLAKFWEGFEGLDLIKQKEAVRKMNDFDRFNDEIVQEVIDDFYTYTGKRVKATPDGGGTPPSTPPSTPPAAPSTPPAPPIAPAAPATPTPAVSRPVAGPAATPSATTPTASAVNNVSIASLYAGVLTPDDRRKLAGDLLQRMTDHLSRDKRPAVQAVLKVLNDPAKFPQAEDFQKLEEYLKRAEFENEVGKLVRENDEAALRALHAIKIGELAKKEAAIRRENRVFHRLTDDKEIEDAAARIATLNTEKAALKGELSDIEQAILRKTGKAKEGNKRLRIRTPEQLLGMINLYLEGKDGDYMKALVETQKQLDAARQERRPKIYSALSYITGVIKPTLTGTLLEVAKKDEALKKIKPEQMEKLAEAWDDQSKVEEWVRSLEGSEKDKMETILPRIIGHLDAALNAGSMARLNTVSILRAQELASNLRAYIHEYAASQAEKASGSDVNKMNVYFGHVNAINGKIAKVQDKIVKENARKLMGASLAAGVGVGAAGIATMGLSTAALGLTGLATVGGGSLLSSFRVDDPETKSKLRHIAAGTLAASGVALGATALGAGTVLAGAAAAPFLLTSVGAKKAWENREAIKKNAPAVAGAAAGVGWRGGKWYAGRLLQCTIIGIPLAHRFRKFFFNKD